VTVWKCAGCGADVVSQSALSYGKITGVYRCAGGYCSKGQPFLHKGAYRSSGSLLERTVDEKFVIGQLADFLGPEQRYRAGVLLLTYADGRDGNTRIAGGFAMSELNAGSAADFVEMIKRLRGLADELEALAQGKRSLSLQGGGDG
jgi:hypothetical protein